MADKEYLLPEGTVILSTADLQGNIVSYNAGFKDASGYTDAELKGKPHSILRHPDMPKEAFQDFWATLQAGLPWYGFVKNKRKNGDYYWVSANATPIKNKGVITGYLSVRYPASRQQIALAESLYADIRAGRAKMPWTKVNKGHKKLGSVIATIACLLPLIFLIDGLEQTAFIVAASLSSLIGLSYLVFNSITSDNISDTIIKGVEDIASQNLSERINDNSQLGFMLNYIRSHIAETSAKNYDAARESLILSTAVDASSTNLMIADSDFNIISVNKALLALFKENEAKFKAELPNFSASTIVGSNMDVFHKNPAHQRQMMQSISGPMKADIKLGGLILQLTIIPIELNGAKFGFVVEWVDRTTEATVIAELAVTLQEMKQGDFSKRITANASGIYLSIKQDVNSAMDSIEHAITAISEVVLAQASGDLTKELPKATFKGQLHDLKNAINYSSFKVKEVVSQGVEASNVVKIASQQVSQGSSNLSARVQEQAAALEETSATMHEMTSAVDANTANARTVANLAQEVRDQSQTGAQVMQQTIEAMQSIQASSHKISDIVSIIDGIAFQTNLLALNAAVEAARAGEHGRGFAVVASEVRALAGKSADAAKDIKGLIEDSVQRIETGTQLADKSGEVLKGITNSVVQVADMIEEIANASNEQSTAINQVNKAIADIDKITQENAALVEETTAAAESLNVEANALSTSMEFFKTGKISKDNKHVVASNNASAKDKATLAGSKAHILLPAATSTENNAASEWSEF